MGKGRVAKLGALAAAIAAVAITGCGGESKTTTSAAAGKVTAGVYVGRVTGTNAYIALATNGTRVGGGYICDGHKLSTWLRTANLHDGQAALISRKGVVVGQASFHGQSATGSITINRAVHTYTAAPATGSAGLYRTATGTAGKPGFTETGWIVLKDGTIRGTRSFINPITTLETQPASGSPKGKTTNSFTDPITGI